MMEVATEAEKLTRAYQKVRLRNRNIALYGVAEVMKAIDPDDIKGSSERLLWRAALYVDEAAQNDEHITRTYLRLMDLIDAGLDFKVDKDFLRKIRWLPDGDNVGRGV